MAEPETLFSSTPYPCPLVQRSVAITGTTVNHSAGGTEGY